MYTHTHTLPHTHRVLRCLLSHMSSVKGQKKSENRIWHIIDLKKRKKHRLQRETWFIPGTVYGQTHTHTHTHLGAHRQQSCSLGLRESLGLPDLHSNRKLQQTATERRKAASVCSTWLLICFCGSFLPRAHLHTAKVKNLVIPLPETARRGAAFRKWKRPSTSSWIACIATWFRSSKIKVLRWKLMIKDYFRRAARRY